MIPNLFTKQAIPQTIPNELVTKINELSQAKTVEEFLHNAFFYIVNRWKGNRLNLVFKFHRLFLYDLDDILNTKGYLHCTTMNYLLRVMAVKSRLIKDSAITYKLTNTWYIAPHQYLQIQLPAGQKLYLDPWNYQFGIEYGHFGSGFASVKLKPMR